MIRHSLLVLGVLLAFGEAGSAAPPNTVFLEELTWTELRDQIQSGKTTILVPIGGTEQSGPYVALGKHNARARYLSEKIAVVLGNALVAPVIAYVPEGSINPPTEHMRFPGTISIPEQTFEQLLEHAARSFKAAGFRDIVFLGEHGGYQHSDKKVAELLNREWAGNTQRVHAAADYYRAATTDYSAQLKSRGFSPAEIGTHAGLADTALLLAINPGMVRADALAEAKLTAADGVHGDPRRATAEVGQLGVNLVISKTVEAIKLATRQH